MPAKSKAQQQLMALALRYKRGEVPDSEVSEKVKELAKGISEDDLKDFAETPTKNLPKYAGYTEVDLLSGNT